MGCWVDGSVAGVAKRADVKAKVEPTPAGTAGFTGAEDINMTQDEENSRQRRKECTPPRYIHHHSYKI